ncbi:MAG: hypothetical protein HY342_11105 [Candidatus Lambdaproteobacteria bacterium]|nr:hypothetical protein [Candidatus Lambdaproteobacteria bacterium]
MRKWWKLLVGPIMLIVGIPGLIDDLKSWGQWLDTASKWMHQQPWLNRLLEINLLHYGLLVVGILLLIPWDKLFSNTHHSNSKVSHNSQQVSVITDAEQNLPNYEDWDKGETVNLWNAAHLWAELEPSAYIDHPGGPAPFYSIFSELKQAVNTGILEPTALFHVDTTPLPNGARPAANRQTIVAKSDLKRYAIEVRKEQPKFLFPEVRSEIGLAPSSGPAKELRLAVKNNGGVGKFYATCRTLANRNDVNMLRAGTFNLAWCSTPERTIALQNGEAQDLLVARWKFWRLQHDISMGQIDILEWTGSGPIEFTGTRWNANGSGRLPEFELEITVFNSDTNTHIARQFTIRPAAKYGPLEMKSIS